MDSFFRNVIVGLFFWVSAAHGSLVQSTGVKYPNTSREGDRPTVSEAWAPENPENLKGFNELLPFVTPSPHQEDAGTCLFMSLTGAAEFWLHRHAGTQSFQPDGDLNLSPRWWANLASHGEFLGSVKDWYSDTIQMFNESDAALNRDYRFTKGYFKEPSKYRIEPADPKEAGAEYGARYNWIDETPGFQGSKVKLPRFSRTALLAGPSNNPWLIGSAPLDIADRVRAELKRTSAPVQVVYNHQGYWHSVIIVGFDEDLSIGECPFIKSSLKSFDEEAVAYEASSRSAVSIRKSELAGWALARRNFKEDLLTSLERTGGCTKKGVFYVRDSIYTDPTGVPYRYDLTNPGADRNYSRRIVLREYDWLTHLANHVTLITAERP